MSALKFLFKICTTATLFIVYWCSLKAQLTPKLFMQSQSNQEGSDPLSPDPLSPAPFGSSPVRADDEDLPPFQDESEADALLGNIGEAEDE